MLYKAVVQRRVQGAGLGGRSQRQLQEGSSTEEGRKFIPDTLDVTCMLQDWVKGVSKRKSKRIGSGWVTADGLNCGMLKVGGTMLNVLQQDVVKFVSYWSTSSNSMKLPSKSSL